MEQKNLKSFLNLICDPSFFQAVSPSKVFLCLQPTSSVTPGFILGPGRIKLKVCVNGGAPLSFTTGHAQTQ